MNDLQGCAICGAAMVDVEKHAEFHRGYDDVQRGLNAVETDAADALQKAEHAANVLYNRGMV